MKLSKKIIRHPMTSFLLGFVLSLHIRLVFYTTRWRFMHHPEVNMESDKPKILAFWHGRMLMMPMIRPKSRTTYALVSLHRDGQFIGSVMEFFSLKLLHGSTSKGGSNALRTAATALRKGSNVAITPDGPRGPAQVSASGALSLAMLSGAPIIPLSFSTTRCKFLPSWDRFALALPFARGIIISGKPIYIPRNADENILENLRKELDRSLNEITSQADELCRTMNRTMILL